MLLILKTFLLLVGSLHRIIYFAQSSFCKYGDHCKVEHLGILYFRSY